MSHPATPGPPAAHDGGDTGGDTGRTGNGLRIVVVGATGNAGTSVLRALAAEPRVGSVLGLARRVPREWTPAKTTWVSADITGESDGAMGGSADLAALFRGADAVIHLAWLFQPTHAPSVTWRTNVLGSLRVFRAAAEAGVPALVYASSVGAYSPGPKDREVTEDWPTDGWPEAAYTREKAYLERCLDAYEREHPDMRVVRMRPGFLFQQEAAAEQRRLFAGPFVPGRLVRPGVVPAVPDLPGLRFQALHADDAAAAYCTAATDGRAHGPYNLAAEPVIDAAVLSRLLDGARVLRLPARTVRSVLAAGWHAHLLPASPQLFDAVLRLPLMDTSRARRELGWSPRWSAEDAVGEFLAGLRNVREGETPTLARRAPGGGRVRELLTGVGQRP
ncbi:NAD-dependent epimerase/dehydratase family protein [Streptomyces sp. ODS28]|uniref:NAD-dependent epimerase/dehydratase family protein n=1 Tax=Streptomyces sp. ODS28 TaxID=3136688 RepID=UPI0031E57767